MLVSAVIPFHNEVDLVVRAVKSVLAQKWPDIEIILVDDGSSEPTWALEGLPVRLIRQSNAGPGAARMRGLKAASGEYIAFLDADDEWSPAKVARQVSVMRETGAFVSHTSYYVRYPERRSDLGVLHSGQFSGTVFPRIIGGCPIATPTVMLHRLAVPALRFPTWGSGEDGAAWIALAETVPEWTGIDEPLAIVEWSDASAALDIFKAALGIENILAWLSRRHTDNRYAEQVAQLRRHLAPMARAWKRGDLGWLRETMIAAAFEQ